MNSYQLLLAYTELLNLCDKVRDEQLVELGVALDDREDGKSLIKFVDREILLAQRQEKLEKELQKRKEKEERQKQQEEKRLERLAKGKVSPLDMFKDEEGRQLYSQWDELGLPTHGIDGEELPKSRRKKLQKEYDGQKKLHEEYLASQ
jgi:cysteinyl-tRNA synthetase